MERTHIEFLSFLLLMVLGIAWDFTFGATKDFVHVTHANASWLRVIEGGLTLLFVWLTYETVRLETRNQTTSRKHFWFAMAALCMIATNIVGEEFVFSLVHKIYAGQFDTPTSLIVLWSLLLIASVLVGMWLYGSRIDTYYGNQKRCNDAIRQQKEQQQTRDGEGPPPKVRAFYAFHDPNHARLNVSYTFRGPAQRLSDNV